MNGRFTLLAVLLAASWFGIGEGEAGYLSYSGWAASGPGTRAAYVAGVMDSYVAFSGSYSASADHYAKCLSRMQLTNGQPAENVLGWAKTRPDLHQYDVPAIVIQYLHEACGSPPA